MTLRKKKRCWTSTKQRLEWPETLPAPGRSGAGVQQKVMQMANLPPDVETFARISQQLRDEGAHQTVIDAAKSLAEKQFGKNPDDEAIGAKKIVIDALAKMMAECPNRPTCCLVHEAKYVQSQLQVLAIEYVEAAKRIENGRPNVG